MATNKPKSEAGSTEKPLRATNRKKKRARRHCEKKKREQIIAVLEGLSDVILARISKEKEQDFRHNQARKILNARKPPKLKPSSVKKKLLNGELPEVLAVTDRDLGGITKKSIFDAIDHYSDSKLKRISVDAASQKLRDCVSCLLRDRENLETQVQIRARCHSMTIEQLHESLVNGLVDRLIATHILREKLDKLLRKLPTIELKNITRNPSFPIEAKVAEHILMGRGTTPAGSGIDWWREQT